MSVLALDLSSTCTGYTKFTSDGKLLLKGKIVPDDKIDPLLKINYVTKKVIELFKDVDELVIEDIFLGSFGTQHKQNVTVLKYLARLSGAIIHSWIDYKYKLPHLLMAVSARPLAGVSGRSHKAEVQIFVLDKYNWAEKSDLKTWKEELEILKIQVDNTTITKGQYKYRLDKLSDEIAKKTEVNEDIADSIILGLAYTCPIEKPIKEKKSKKIRKYKAKACSGRKIRNILDKISADSTFSDRFRY